MTNQINNLSLTIGLTRKFKPHRGTRGEAFDLLNKRGYILWMVALLEVFDVTSKGRHLGGDLGFYQELEIRLKPREMVIFFVLDMKNNT